jgi:hypothetical protein
MTSLHALAPVKSRPPLPPSRVSTAPAPNTVTGFSALTIMPVEPAGTVIAPAAAPVIEVMEPVGRAAKASAIDWPSSVASAVLNVSCCAVPDPPATDTEAMIDPY